MRTQLAVTKTKYQLNKEQILESLHLTREEYNILMHDLGLEWARFTFCEEEETVSKLTLNPKFWRWWQNQWNIREDAFLTEYIDFILAPDDFSKFLLAVWDGYHSLAAIEAYPSTEILNQLFAEVMGETIDQIHAEMQKNFKP